ncbi:MAG TPA: hypothetical protein VLB44_13010 [Kofleriaceae bacterium]|nr:hypothetical protein [Kofleriaceae bacterium]
MGRIASILLLLYPAVASAKPRPEDLAFMRVALPATGQTRVESRVIYLNPGGVVLKPGDNDARTGTSSIVTAPTSISPWNVDDATWADTVACMREIYAPFDVTITDEDPGDVPHIEAVFGGAPGDVGLPDNVAGVSPFTTDCAVIDNSIVFAFTDVLPDDARSVCEVMAQEVAHSFGLDHELLPSDPMTYLSYAGERTFQDEMASCGEYGGRMCGIDGSVCRTRQNSYRLLLETLGPSSANPAGRDDPGDVTDDPLRSGVTSGCSASGGGIGIWLVLLVGHVVSRRRSRGRRHRSLLQRSSCDREGGS